MVLGRDMVLLQGVEGCFETLMEDGSKATSRRLECVMLFMLKCGKYNLGLDMAWRENTTHLNYSRE